MTKQITQIPSRWFKILATMSFLMILGGFAQVSAQCSYFKIANSESTVKQIPSDFPVLDFSAATADDKVKFKITVADWKKKNPGFDEYSFSLIEPVTSPIPEFITISASDFDSYEKQRQQIILSNPAFYRVN